MSLEKYNPEFERQISSTQSLPFPNPISQLIFLLPPKQVENIDSILIEDKKELEKYIETTGVKRRYHQYNIHL